MIQLLVSTRKQQKALSVNIVGNSSFVNPLSTVYATSHTTTNPGEEAVLANESIYGDWKAFHVDTHNSYGASNAPAIGSGGLEFSVAGNTNEGPSAIYQQVFNEPNSIYELTYTVVSNNVTFGILVAKDGAAINTNWYQVNLNGTNQVFGETGVMQGIPTTVGTHTVQINTLNYSTSNFMLTFDPQVGSAGQKLVIKDIILREVINGSTFTDIDKFENVDLYKDENIPLVLSIDEFTKAGEQTQSYSKNFTLPATKVNNKIFKHVFDITAESEFNVHRQTACIVKQNTVDIFEGYLRMTAIKHKQDEISYEVNLFNNIISLKDALGEKTFNDIDFTELEHNYNRTTINGTQAPTPGTFLSNALPTTSFAYDASLGANTTNAILYPFCDWTGHIPATPTAFTPIILEQAFRPWLKVKYLWDRIIDEAGYTWSHRHMTAQNQRNFDELYMDMSWGSSNEFTVGYYNSMGTASHLTTKTGTGFSFYGLSVDFFGVSGMQRIPLDTESPPNVTGWDNSAFEFVSPANHTFVTVDYNFTIYGFNDNSQYKFEIRHNSIVASQSDPFDTQTGTFAFTSTVGDFDVVNIQGNFSMALNAGEKFWFELTEVAGTIFMVPNDPSGNGVSFINIFQSGTGANINQMLLRNRGELGQWEFISNIAKKFNFVFELDTDNKTHIYIDPWIDWVNGGERKDWTNKIDSTSIDYNVIGDLEKEVLFTDEQDDDFYNNIYFDNVNEVHGQATFEDPNNELATGNKTINTIFSPTIIDSLSLANNARNYPTLRCFQVSDDGTANDFNNKPRLGYMRYRVFNGYQITYPAQNGQTAGASTDVTLVSPANNIQPSSPQSFSIGWATPFSFYNISQSTSKQAFTKYWLDYMRELYDDGTRIVKAKIYLTESDIRYFSFNDKIQFKNRDYRVNKINYNPDKLSTIELIRLQ